MDKQSKENVFNALLVATIENTDYDTKREIEYGKLMSRLEELCRTNVDMISIQDDPRYPEVPKLCKGLYDISKDDDRIEGLINQLEDKLLEWMNEGSIIIERERIVKSNRYSIRIYRNGERIRFNLYSLDEGFVEEKYDGYLLLAFNHKWTKYFSRIGDKRMIRKLTR